MTGSIGDDLDVGDPDNLASTRVTDLGGIDTLRVRDRPGRDSGKSLVTSAELVRRNYEGEEVRFAPVTFVEGEIEWFE